MIKHMERADIQGLIGISHIVHKFRTDWLWIVHGPLRALITGRPYIRHYCNIVSRYRFLYDWVDPFLFIEGVFGMLPRTLLLHSVRGNIDIILRKQIFSRGGTVKADFIVHRLAFRRSKIVLHDSWPPRWRQGIRLGLWWRLLNSNVAQ